MFADEVHSFSCYCSTAKQYVDLTPGHAGVISMAVDPASQLAACSAMDSRVRVFDLDTNASVATLESFPSETWGVAFHPQVVDHS